RSGPTHSRLATLRRSVEKGATAARRETPNPPQGRSATMSAWPRTAATLAAAGLLLALAPLPAQEKPRTPAAMAAWPFRYLVEGGLAAQRLEAARAFARRQDWKAAVALVQKVLDDDKDPLGPADGDGLRRGLRPEAQRLLASLPAEGRDAYQAEFDDRAANWLKEALKLNASLDREDERLTAIVRRYLYPDAGPEAVRALAALAAEEGDEARAASAYGLLERHRGLARWTPEELFAAARALRRAGDRAGSGRLEAELLGRVGP